MPNFILNRRTQDNGDNEVHNTTTGCHKMPAAENQIVLGTHITCHGAVAYAKALYGNARINGCIHCCNPCHTT